MQKKRNHLYQDILLLAFSIVFTIFIVETGLIHKLIGLLADFKLIGIVVAGMFFTSMFTTPPSIAILGTFAETTPLPVLAILGGFGAMLGDYIIFRFVKDRITKDFEYLFSISKIKRFSYIFKNRIFKLFTPFVGALIIASPLPDEIGIAMLGISKLKDRAFFLISFVMNSIGIYIIGWITTRVLGL